jgi:hypothetical protein
VVEEDDESSSEDDDEDDEWYWSLSFLPFWYPDAKGGENPISIFKFPIPGG